MTRHDPDLHFVHGVLEDDAAWLARHAADIHELAYGASSSNPDVVVQTFSDHDVSDLIGTHAQTLWGQLRDLADRIIAAREHASRLFAGGHPEWRPRQRDLDRERQRELQAAQDRRRERGDYTPVRLVHRNDR